MAVGGYSMAILVLKAGFSFWLALPAAILITMAFGALVGLPSLRLRADYFAIVTLAMAEVVRLVAQNARGLTGGNQGLFCNFEDGSQTCFDDSWRSVSNSILDFIDSFWSEADALVPLLIVVWVTVADRHRPSRPIQSDAVGEGAAGGPRGRGRGAGARQEHPPLQAPVAGDLGGAGRPRAASSSRSSWRRSTPHDYEPIVTFFAFGVLILGGLASYWGVAVGADPPLDPVEGTRFVELPISEEKTAALRFAIVGLVLILLMAFRPAGPVRQARGDGAR